MKFTTLVKAFCLALLTCVIIGEETGAGKGAATSMNADVRKVLDILVNSLYTNRDIFLREIISNASDALDKIRFLYLTNPKEPKNDEGEEPTMDIRIMVDKEARHFIMRDGGVGMTKSEMESALGSLGTSGTKKFLEGMQTSEGRDGNNLIGQFGVGFYSVFLVAENVRVASKSDDSDKQWVWESTGDGTYFVYEDPRGNTLGRGTELTLELKKDADEFLEDEHIEATVHRYSEFINFPILLQEHWASAAPKSEKSEVAPPAEEGEVQEEGEVREEQGDGEEEEPEPEITTDWKLLNKNKPIWTRPLDEIDQNEYVEFYKSLTKNFDEPMYWTHFTATGEVAFKALLFVPGKSESMFDSTVVHRNIKLYVRRVFITDEFKDLVPRYLNFIDGIVDSDDLPLNVSREVLQESRILKVIKKKLVRRALGMLQEIADNDVKIAAAAADTDATQKHEGSKHQDKVLYPTLWKEFGKAIRLGMIDDGTNRARLTKLLRYYTSKSEETLVSLEEYIDRMPDTQKNIYFMAAESVEQIKSSPAFEDAESKGVEVIFMVDPIDEYVVGHVTDFAGKKLVNLAKEGGVTLDLSEKEKRIQQHRSKHYKPLLSWIKSLLADRVKKVKLSLRKMSEPLFVSTAETDISVNLARINKAQSITFNQGETSVKGVLEVNHRHPLIDEIFKRITVDEEDVVAKELMLTLFDTSALHNGFEIPEGKAFGHRLGRLLRQSVEIAADAPLLEEDTSEYELEIEEEEAEELAAAEQKKEEAEAKAAKATEDDESANAAAGEEKEQVEEINEDL